MCSWSDWLSIVLQYESSKSVSVVGATKSSHFISHSNESCCGHVRWENHPLTPARRRLAVHERAPPAAGELKTFRVYKLVAVQFSDYQLGSRAIECEQGYGAEPST
jgi:hypothetical protein